MPSLDATVQFTTAIYGIHAAGTVYRMDEVPIPVRQLLETALPTDEDVLRAIAADWLTMSYIPAQNRLMPGAKCQPTALRGHISQLDTMATPSSGQGTMVLRTAW